MAGEEVRLADAMEEEFCRGGHGQIVREQAGQNEEEKQVDQEDDRDGKDQALAGEIGLAQVHHARREREMKAPENAEAEVEDGLPRLERIPEIDG